MFTNILRNFSTGKVFRAAETPSLLAKLRKNTGYTFANCKKALEMHNNDLNKAENWLHKQAQTLGWSKATKLAGRTTGQGLVAVRFDGTHAALVEINCETDFVARNEKFHSMIEEAANACFKFAHSGLHAKGPLTKMCLDCERLGALHAANGKTLLEQLALMIGSVGENAALRRAECWKAAPGLKLTGYTHPASAHQSDYSTGKYGGLMAYTVEDKTVDATVVSRQICQHIVGMNPTKIGNEEDDKPNKEADEEACLIFQEYLLDPSQTMLQILKDNKITVVDFVRFECGESLELPHSQPLETVQTCQ